VTCRHHGPDATCAACSHESNVTYIAAEARARQALVRALRQRDVLAGALGEIVDIMDSHQDFQVRDLIDEVKSIAQSARGFDGLSGDGHE
jgi:hypothetical protein